MDSIFPKEEQTSSAKSPTLILPFSSPQFSFIHGTPFSRLPVCLNPNFPLLVETSNVVREVQKSIGGNVDRCLKMLEDLRARNGFLDGIMSFSSHLQNNCEVRLRNGRNLSMLHNSNFAAILPGDSVAGVVVGNGIMNFLNIYNTLLVARLVLTWFPNAPPAIVSPLSTICDPYLNIFRGIIPPLGGTLDLSPILAFLVLNAFTSAAAALPAELPSTEGIKGCAPHIKPSHITSSQEKWMRRFTGIKPRTSSGDV